MEAQDLASTLVLERKESRTPAQFNPEATVRIPKDESISSLTKTVLLSLPHLANSKRLQKLLAMLGEFDSIHLQRDASGNMFYSQEVHPTVTQLILRFDELLVELTSRTDRTNTDSIRIEETKITNEQTLRPSKRLYVVDMDSQLPFYTVPVHFQRSRKRSTSQSIDTRSQTQVSDAMRSSLRPEPFDRARPRDYYLNPSQPTVRSKFPDANTTTHFQTMFRCETRPLRINR